MDRLTSQLAELGSPFGDLNVNLLQMQETWIEVLEWLLKSYDMDLFNSMYKNTSDEQGKYKDLTSILNIIGLANANDTTVVQGQISVQQKLQILNALADLVLLDRDITFQSSVEEQMSRDVQLLGHVARDQKRLFEDELNLFPAHMQPLIAAASKTKAPAAPSLSELKLTIQELDLNRQQLLAQLEQINEQIPQGTTLPSVRDMRSMQQDMSLQAEQLVAAMKQFAEVYNTQIYSWTNQPQPQLNGVGPAAEKVHSVYQNITQLLREFEDMKDSYAKLTHNSKMEALFASADLDQNEIYALKENIAILDQAVERQMRQYPSNLVA
jgi:hypothetical protein